MISPFSALTSCPRLVSRVCFPALLPQLKKLITPGIGGARIIGTDDKGFLGDRVKTGQLEIEVIPHGIWIERLHAAAMGLGEFYNPVGVGTSIAEVDELVEVGEIDPEMIVTAGVYIDRIVKIPEGDVGSAKQKRDLIAMFLENEMIRRLVFGPMKKGGQE